MAAHEEYIVLGVQTSRAVPEPKRWRWVLLCLPLSPRIIVCSSCRFSNVYNAACGWRWWYEWVSSSSSSRMARTSCPVKWSLEDPSDILALSCFYHFSWVHYHVVFQQNYLPSVCERICAKLNAWWHAPGASRMFTKGKLCHCYKHSVKGVSNWLS